MRQTDVVGPGLAPVAPPGVALRTRIQRAKHIDKADARLGVEQPGHPGALFGEEPAVLLVAAPVLEVDRLVGDVDVAHQHELALCLELPQVRLDQREEAELRLLASLAAAAAREIAADDAEARQSGPAVVVETGLDPAAFVVELRVADATSDLRRLPAAIEADAGVTLLQGVMKVSRKPSQPVEAAVDDVGLRLGLLHPHTIWSSGSHPRLDSLRGRGADAIQVQCDQSEHRIPQMSPSGHSHDAQDTLAQDFVKFSLEAGVLRFGEFKTKAGRLSPYFFNAGLFDDGAKLGRLAEFYARRLQQARAEGRLQFDMLFGPAYKGIVLAAAVAIELARLGCNVPYAYNRKEAKDHGEGGTLVGRTGARPGADHRRRDLGRHVGA